MCVETNWSGSSSYSSNVFLAYQTCFYSCAMYMYMYLYYTTCTYMYIQYKYIYTCMLDWLVSVVARGETQHSLLLTTVNCVVPPTLTLFTNFHSMLHTMLHTLYMLTLTFCNNLCTVHTMYYACTLYITFCSNLFTLHTI